MSEASSHQDDYGRGLRAAARGYWGGTWSRNEALDAFALAIEVGLRWAWIEGMAEVGIPREEITEEEWAQQTAIVTGILQHLPDLLTFIEDNSKGAAGLLATVLGRVDLWENEYNATLNAAKLAGHKDPPGEWHLGPTKEHCWDCGTYVGKVYRMSVWHRWGAIPQSRALACHGYRCECHIDPTDRPLTRGHPPAPTGGD